MPTPTTPEEATERLPGAPAAEGARAPAPSDDAGGIEVLEFRLGDARYAVETRHIREVVTTGPPAPLPNTPSFVRGLVNVRGEILSVLDLRALLGLPPGAPSRSSHVIILWSDDMIFGAEADAVVGVRGVAPGALDPSPAVSQAGHQYLSALSTDGLAVLDGARLLGDAALVVRDERPATLGDRPQEPPWRAAAEGSA